MASCFVSYLDIDGIRHSVEVEAGSLYEAAVLAATTLKQHQCGPADTSNLEIEIRSSVTHTITLKKVRQWLEGGARSPKEAVTKERLRELLSSVGFNEQNESDRILRESRRPRVHNR